MLSQKIHHFFDLGYELIYRHIVLILLILLCLGIGIGLAGSYKLSMNIMEVQAQQNAEISITTIGACLRSLDCNRMGTTISISR